MKAILECVASIKSWNKAFCLLFMPAMLYTLWGMVELYTTHYNLLTSEDHMEFFLRFFFPISVGLFITSLERRKRLRENAELKTKIEKYLNDQ
jgi:hypothetical protein